MSITETNDETIEEGSIVVLKTGSPHMLIIKVPGDGESRARCIFWNNVQGSMTVDDYPMIALETLEAHQRRLQKFQEHLLQNAAGPFIKPDEKTVIIQFDSVEEKDAYLAEHWTDVQQYKGKLN